MAIPSTRRGETSATVGRIPAAGYPVSEEAVEYWFRNHYGRSPTEREIGAIIGEMAQREATPPHHGRDAASQGWVVGPPAPPTR